MTELDDEIKYHKLCCPHGEDEPWRTFRMLNEFTDRTLAIVPDSRTDNGVSYPCWVVVDVFCENIDWEDPIGKGITTSEAIIAAAYEVGLFKSKM